MPTLPRLSLSSPTQPSSAVARSVLVLGANGRIGRAVATAFHSAGWAVAGQVRRPLDGTPGIAPVEAPLSDPGLIAARAAGARVVVHALNPIYTRWDQEAMPAMDAAIEVARRLGATLMFPGNVYNFGDPIATALDEDTPQSPNHPKAAIRIALEARLHTAADAGLRSIVIRAGDFFGAGQGAWFDQLITKDISRGRLVYPGPHGLAHAWAYLPDLARTFVAVAERRDALAPFATLHFGGHTLTGAQLIEALQASAQRLGLAASAPLAVRGVPWTLLRAAGLFAPTLRELARMRYLWQQPHALLDRRLRELIGAVPHTPLADAIDATLRLQLAAATRREASPVADPAARAVA